MHIGCPCVRLCGAEQYLLLCSVRFVTSAGPGSLPGYRGQRGMRDNGGGYDDGASDISSTSGFSAYGYRGGEKKKKSRIKFGHIMQGERKCNHFPIVNINSTTQDYQLFKDVDRLPQTWAFTVATNCPCADDTDYTFSLDFESNMGQVA